MFPGVNEQKSRWAKHFILLYNSNALAHSVMIWEEWMLQRVILENSVHAQLTFSRWIKVDIDTYISDICLY